MWLVGNLQALGSVITQICSISGTPGLSLGVLHNGEVIHQANFGFRDVDAQFRPNEDTSYVVGSLTKALTAAMVGILVHDGKLNWTTQLQEIIPNFQRPEKDPTINFTVTDLLSHRTGLPSYDALWLLSNNRIPLDRADAVPILGYVPVAAALRTEFIYNNMAYEVLGQVIEAVSGTNYSSFLQDRILNPLGMTRTFYTNSPINDDNTATPYATLENAAAFQLPLPLHGDNVMMGPAGGVRSSVHDMLLLYSAFIDAEKSQIDRGESKIPLNPLKQLAHLWQGMINLPLAMVRENSYACGWLRMQLPAPMGYGSGPGINPMLGEGLPSRLGLFHEGNIPGFTSFAAVFPETSSAVVVLSNSIALTDSVRLVGQLLIEELFNNTINATDYTHYAESTAREGASIMSNIKKELIRHKTADEPAHSLQTYVGRYYNSIGNFYIDIRESGGILRVYFMGLDSDGFDLEPYQHNSFFWHISHNECAKLARYTAFPKDYYVIRFGQINENSHDSNEAGINCLWWKHEFTVPDNGEVYRKKQFSDLQQISQKPLRTKP